MKGLGVAAEPVPVALSSERVGPDDGLPVVWLHGFLGDRGNLRTTARAVSDLLERPAVLVDLRNHGDSPHADPSTSAAMAEDVGALLGSLGTADVVGHSLGGRVAMHAALRFPTLVRRLVVVDIAPRPYPAMNADVLSALRALDLATLPDRRSADARLAETIADAGTRRFLLKSLQGEAGAWRWRFALDRIVRDYAMLHSPLPEGATFDGPTLVVRGERSSYVSDADEALYPHWFRDLRIERLASGHWVHIEAAEAFRQTVAAFLR